MSARYFFFCLVSLAGLMAAAPALAEPCAPYVFIAGEQKFVELGPRTAPANVVLPVRKKGHVDDRMRDTTKLAGTQCGADRGETMPSDQIRLARDGVTVLSFAITENGRPAGIWVWRSSGSKALDQAAIDAIAASRYEPAKIDGKAVTLQWRAAVTWRSALSNTPHRLPDLTDQDQYACQFNLPGAVARCSNAIAAVSGLKIAAAYYWRGIAYGTVGDRTNAIADFGKTLESEPDNADAFYYRAVNLAALNRNEEALADVNRALSLQPDNDRALLIRAFAYEQLGQIDNAQKDRAAVLKHASGCVPAHAAECSDYQRRLADLDHAVSQNPKDPDALNASCAQRASANRDLDKALEDCNAGLALASDYAPLHSSLALVDMRLGRYGDALKELEHVPPSQAGAESIYLRGIAKLHTGDNDGGKADVFKAEDMDPDIAIDMLYANVTP